MPAGLPQTPKRSLFDLREFDVRFSGGNRLPKTSSAHFLRKSAATKLFRPISSGNRPPQTFSAHFLRKSLATNFFGSFPQEIARHKLFQLISSGNRWDGLPLISSGNRRMAYIELTLNQKPRPQTSVNRGWRRGFPYAGLLR